MDASAESHALTSPLDRWEVELTSGETVVVWAHGASERDDRLVFVALMTGKPHFEVEVATLPKSIVADFSGG